MKLAQKAASSLAYHTPENMQGKKEARVLTRQSLFDSPSTSVSFSIPNIDNEKHQGLLFCPTTMLQDLALDVYTASASILVRYLCFLSMYYVGTYLTIFLNPLQGLV